MTKHTSKTDSLDVYQPDFKIKPEDYEPYIGKDRVEDLKKLALPIEGRSWTNINSTLMGGGVAEILRSLVPLVRGLGVDANWVAIRGNNPFFQTTKKFHNMLQGLDLPVSIDELFGAYLDNLEENAKGMSIASDLIVVHDPQPVGLINLGVLFGNVIWRCHIDTSKPHKTVWRFLLPFINQYDGAIFTMPEFVGPGVHVPQYEISPCIDPKAQKNKQVSREEALKILEPLFKQHNIDADRPIFTVISRYDIHKNQEASLKAFKKLREEKKLSAPPYLIFLGNTATDDPEGETVLEMLKNKAGDDPDVKFWVNVENNDKVVGALMKIARCFNHVSTKEGFGLVVSEALWQGTPVIGSKIGGITKQVVNEKNGFLVDPNDVDTIANKMAWILDNPKEAETLGKNGIEHVRDNFLLPSLVKKYFTLMHTYTKKTKQTPDFRLNGRSYKEVLRSIDNNGLDSIPPDHTGNGSEKQFKIA